MATRIITCRELNGFLADYLAGALPTEQRNQFERHLAVCPTCVRYVRQYRDTVRFGRRALLETNHPAPDDVPQELVDAILELRPHRPR